MLMSPTLDEALIKRILPFTSTISDGSQATKKKAMDTRKIIFFIV
jgi:hypothetical protein